MLPHIHLVDITSIEKFRGHHFRIIRRSTLYSWSRLLITIIGCIRLSPRGKKHGSHHVELRYTLLQTMDILIVHAPPATLTESLVGFGSLLFPDDNGILSEALEILLEQFLQALSTSHQCDEHEHAPEHTKAREE